MRTFGSSIAIVTTIVTVFGLAGCGATTAPDRDSAGAVTKAADAADIFSLRVGDCIPRSFVEAKGEETTVTETSVVPCAEPHESEVFAAFLATGGSSFPGSDAMLNQAETGCPERFEAFVGLPLDDSNLELTYLFPVRESWATGDRQILCIVDDPTGDVKGTMRGAKR